MAWGGAVVTKSVGVLYKKRKTLSSCRCCSVCVYGMLTIKRSGLDMGSFIASMASVIGSLYIYFVTPDEMLGIFVGLWAPTLILATKEIEEWLNN